MRQGLVRILTRYVFTIIITFNEDQGGETKYYETNEIINLNYFFLIILKRRDLSFVR